MDKIAKLRKLLFRPFLYLHCPCLLPLLILPLPVCPSESNTEGVDHFTGSPHTASTLPWPNYSAVAQRQGAL